MVEDKQNQNKTLGVVVISLIIMLLLLICTINVKNSADNLELEVDKLIERLNISDKENTTEIVINDMTNETFNKTEFIKNITPEGLIDNVSTEYDLNNSLININ